MTTSTPTVPVADKQDSKGSGLGIAGFATSTSGFVIGLGSMVFMFMLPLAVGIVGASLSLAALLTGRGKGWAIAGLILGVLAVSLGIMGFVAMDQAISDLDEAINSIN